MAAVHESAVWVSDREYRITDAELAVEAALMESDSRIGRESARSNREDIDGGPAGRLIVTRRPRAAARRRPRSAPGRFARKLLIRARRVIW